MLTSHERSLEMEVRSRLRAAVFSIGRFTGLTPWWARGIGDAA